MLQTLPLMLLTFPVAAMAFSASTVGTSTTNIFEYLKWGGAKPDFDVLEQTKEYTSVFERTGKGPGPEWYDDDYVLRGG